MSSSKTILTIDWEEIMTTTERNSKNAAKMAERTVAALAEALAIQRRHSHQLNRLEKSVEEVKARASSVPNPCRHRSSHQAPRQRIRKYHLIGVFVMGAVCAEFFANW